MYPREVSGLGSGSLQGGVSVRGPGAHMAMRPTNACQQCWDWLVLRRPGIRDPAALHVSSHTCKSGQHAEGRGLQLSLENLGLDPPRIIGVGGADGTRVLQCPCVTTLGMGRHTPAAGGEACVESLHRARQKTGTGELLPTLGPCVLGLDQGSLAKVDVSAEGVHRIGGGGAGGGLSVPPAVLSVWEVGCPTGWRWRCGPSVGWQGLGGWLCAGPLRGVATAGGGRV